MNHENGPSTGDLTGITYDFTVPARQPWSRIIKAGEVLRILDISGQQAVDFLCYDASDLSGRYNAMNTIKVQQNAYISLGTVLYSDAGTSLFTTVADTLGQHDTVHGCCSNPQQQAPLWHRDDGELLLQFHG